MMTTELIKRLQDLPELVIEREWSNTPLEDSLKPTEVVDRDHPNYQEYPGLSKWDHESKELSLEYQAWWDAQPKKTVIML